MGSRIQALPPAGCVTVGKLLTLSEPGYSPINWEGPHLT